MTIRCPSPASYSTGWAQARMRDLSAAEATVAADHVAQTSPGDGITAQTARAAPAQRGRSGALSSAVYWCPSQRRLPIAQVIALPEDVHDLNGLRQVGELLVGADRPTSEEN